MTEHKPLEFPENRDEMIAKAIEADEEIGGCCSAGDAELDTWNDDGGKQ